MWKILSKELEDKTEQLRKLEKETYELRNKLENLKRIINEEVNKELNIYVKNKNKSIKEETKLKFNFNILYDCMNETIMNMELRDENDNLLHSCKLVYIENIIKNVKNKTKMVNIRVHWNHYIQNVSEAEGRMIYIKQDHITGDERYYYIEEESGTIENNKFILDKPSGEGSRYLENNKEEKEGKEGKNKNLDSFTSVFNNLADILLFYDYRSNLHKNHDVISTKKSVYYLLKHFRSPGSTLSHFPKDIIIYICKKALTFQ